MRNCNTLLPIQSLFSSLGVIVVVVKVASLLKVLMGFIFLWQFDTVSLTVGSSAAVAEKDEPFFLKHQGGEIHMYLSTLMFKKTSSVLVNVFQTAKTLRHSLMKGKLYIMPNVCKFSRRGGYCYNRNVSAQLKSAMIIDSLSYLPWTQSNCTKCLISKKKTLFYKNIAPHLMCWVGCGFCCFWRLWS